MRPARQKKDIAAFVAIIVLLGVSIFIDQASVKMPGIFLILLLTFVAGAIIGRDA